MEDLLIVMPEIVLLTMACICLVVDLFTTPKTQVITNVFSLFSLLLTAFFAFYFPYGENTLAFAGHFIADPFAQTLKIIVLVLMFFVVLYSRSFVRERKMPIGEFHALALFLTLGMMFLISAKSLLMIFLGLELLSLPLYAMVAMQRDSPVTVEASMKYFIMGALASGMLLYGMSLLYGLTGSIQLDQIAQAMKAGNAPLTVSLYALVFVIVGVAFKLGAVPFHMWVPDVYQGAPTNITLLVGSAPKVAAFGMAYRLLHDALQDYSAQWSQFFIIIAVLSLAIGNIVAIAQTNLKRLLAYSTIAHVGFLFLALLAAPIAGYAPAMYYIVVYALVAVCAFGVIIILSQQFDADKLSDLKGLSTRSPWLAFLMLLVAFSLTGVPPTVGFYAKFIVLSALVDAGYTWLAALAVVFSIIGAFYYLKIIKMMYFEPAEDPFPVRGPLDLRIALSINGVAVLALGIIPAPLYMICQRVLSSSL